MPSFTSPPPPQPEAKASAAEEDEEEDDYLKMTFDEPAPTKTGRETLTQARKRKQLHSETAGRPKSKAELAEEEARKREAALATKLEASNKGMKLMEKLGYKAGTALGVAREGEQARLEPITVSLKEDRSGIGRESEQKRKIRELAEEQGISDKKRKLDEGEFVDRVRAEREEKRKEGQAIGAQKVCERLEEEDMPEDERKKRKLRSVNVLWRGLVKHRELAEREKRQRHEIYTSLGGGGRLPQFDDPDEDADDKLALGRKDKSEIFEVDDTELDEDDAELEDFEALEPAEKLDKLVGFLRTHWKYCFWCKYRYPDEEMEGCPGLTEEDHD